MFSAYNGVTEGIEGKVNEIKSGYNILLQIKERRRNSSRPFFERLIENVESRLIDIMGVAFPPIGREANVVDQYWIYAHRKEIETALPIFKELRARYGIPWDYGRETAFNTMLENLSIERIYADDYKSGGKLAKKNAHMIGAAATVTATGTGAGLSVLSGPLIPIVMPTVSAGTFLIGCTSTLIGGNQAKKKGAKEGARVAENAIRVLFGLAATS